MVHIIEDMVEQAMLGWLEELGYEAVFGPDIAFDGSSPERKNYKQVVLVDRLRAALHRINPDLPQQAINDALDVVVNSSLPGLVTGNRTFHGWLVNGVQTVWQQDGETRGGQVKLVAYDDADKNDWLVVNQFTVQGPHQTRRPDAVVFLNGLPLAVIELKNPADEHADVWAAFNQLQAYKEDIPDLFRSNEILIASDSTYARMGSLTANQERFAAWRTIDGKTLDPLGSFQELETMVRGVFDRAFFLDYLKHFVLFEDDGGIQKKIAAYHQFHAVRAVVERVHVASEPGGSGKGGVVWHTQGAGKSLEMTCLAGKLMADPLMKNPTLVVVTDRNDLDGQLFGVFANTKELLLDKPQAIENRQALRDSLNNRPSGGIIFTTIQKFMPGEDEDSMPELTTRNNVVVICDEAHRSQYGMTARIDKKTGEYVYGYAKYLRDALPNATFVAFTGTPISTADKDTQAVFGEYVSVYDIEQAVKDKATVPIYYESRLAKLEIDAEMEMLIDEEVDELTEDEEESVQEQTKSRWAALEKLVGAQPRIDKIAADLVAHYEARDTAMAGKAMIVCMSREVCVQLYNAIKELRPDWHDTDPEKGAIKIVMTGSASDKAHLKPHIYSKQIKKRLEARFKKPDDPLRVVIVRDMWLTGFDVPCLTTMYVDKPMKDHNLMQAIARVNRVFRDKPGGLVVDYIGIANELKRALKTYTASKGKGRPTIDASEAFSILLEKLDVVHGILHDIDYSEYRTKALKLLPAVVNHVLGLHDGKRRYADCVLAISQAFALCCTLDEAQQYRDEIAFLQAVRAVMVKGDPKKSLDDDAKEHALRQILSKALISGEVIDIFTAAGLKRPNVGILNDEFLEDVRRMKEKNLAVEVLQRLLTGDIQSRFASNVVQHKKFSDLLKNSLVRYRNRAVETAQVIEELIAMAKDFHEAALRGEKLGLKPEEIAFYDALASNEASVRELGDEILKKIALELTEKLRTSVTVDWAVRDSVRAKLRIMVKTILKKYKYPPDQQEEATEIVLKQAEVLSAAWACA